MLRNVVARGHELAPDGCPGASTLMAHQVWHILHHEESRLMVIQNRDDVICQVPVLGAGQPELLTRLGEVLAREARAQDVMRRNVLGPNFSDVASRAHAEILLVKTR